MSLAGAGRMARKRQKAITEAPVLAGRRDSCLQTDPDSVVYIDLPKVLRYDRAI